jgi:hypothetical protein
MSTRPTQYAFENAEAFQDESVAAANHLRPPYPPKVFEVLVGLITTSPRRVLDVGCGPAQAEAFDQATRQRLEARYPDGLVELQVVGRVIWGRPG